MSGLLEVALQVAMVLSFVGALCAWLDEEFAVSASLLSLGFVIYLIGDTIWASRPVLSLVF